MALDDGVYTIEARNAAEDSQSNTIDLQYEVKVVKRFPQPGSQGFSGLPALDPTNSFQFNLGGKKSNFTLEFVLYDDGTDRSNGTLSNSTISDPRFSGGTITTVEEQEIWLDEYINSADLAVDWKFYGGKYTDREAQGEGTSIVITEARPEPSPDRPTSTRYIVQANLGRRVI